MHLQRVVSIMVILSQKNEVYNKIRILHLPLSWNIKVCKTMNVLLFKLFSNVMGFFF